MEKNRNKIDDDFEYYIKIYREVSEKINGFTNLLNKYNKEYKVNYYDNLATIEVDEIEICFYINDGGSIVFTPIDDMENRQDKQELNNKDKVLILDKSEDEIKGEQTK